MKFNLRLLYLYLFSFVGLLIVVIGSIQLVDLGLKTFIFKDADRYVVYPMNKEEIGYISDEEQQKRQDDQIRQQRQSQIVNALSMIMVGTPLYLYHWGIIKKESKS